MTPIDDELRNLFHSRADVLSPAPDPLHGIEQRARRMRRNRIAASVAGSALAVSALAIAATAVLPDRGGDDGVQYAGPRPSASAPASVQPSPSAVLDAAALDPQNPWAYRGDPKLLGNGTLDTIKREWAIKHPGTTLTPLYGYVYEPSAAVEIAFVSTSQGSDRWGIAVATESGPEFVHDQALTFGAKVLMAALPGDEVARLLVIAAPSTGDIAYAADGTTFQSVPMPEAGIGFHSLEGDTSKDAVRILDGDGDLDDPVFQGLAPDYGSASGAGAPSVTTPDNLVTWPTRGTSPSDAVVEQAMTAFAQALGAKRDDVEHRLLFATRDEAGRDLLLGQAWISGNDAHTFGWVGGSPGELFLGPVTDKGPAVLAFLAAAAPGQSQDTLVVVPEPAVTTTYWGPAASEYVEIVNQERYAGATVINRPKGEQGDMLKLLDAQGQRVFEGQVQPLLCSAQDCD